MPDKKFFLDQCLRARNVEDVLTILRQKGRPDFNDQDYISIANYLSSTTAYGQHHKLIKLFLNQLSYSPEVIESIKYLFCEINDKLYPIFENQNTAFVNLRMLIISITNKIKLNDLPSDERKKLNGLLNYLRNNDESISNKNACIKKHLPLIKTVFGPETQNMVLVDALVENKQNIIIHSFENNVAHAANTAPASQANIGNNNNNQNKNESPILLTKKNIIKNIEALALSLKNKSIAKNLLSSVAAKFSDKMSTFNKINSIIDNLKTVDDVSLQNTAQEAINELNKITTKDLDIVSTIKLVVSELEQIIDMAAKLSPQSNNIRENQKGNSDNEIIINPSWRMDLAHTKKEVLDELGLLYVQSIRFNNGKDISLWENKSLATVILELTTILSKAEDKDILTILHREKQKFSEIQGSIDPSFLTHATKQKLEIIESVQSHLNTLSDACSVSKLDTKQLAKQEENLDKIFTL